ncbi:MAG TPA: hypothetical protein VNF08_01495 [Acidimicrobiales bacterium]|nr:hypothetical protein [Acidimicrobiales bacterium]
MEKVPTPAEELGGESACYAHLLCGECGAVLDEHHHEPCGVRDERVNTSPIEVATRDQETK